MPSFDTSGLDRLAADFSTAAAKVVPALVPVAHRAGANMKKDMQREASGHRNLASLPRFVSYDVDTTATSVAVDVGFRKEGAGNLANIAAFGTSRNAPVMDITAPLVKELPKFLLHVATAVAKAV